MPRLIALTLILLLAAVPGSPALADAPAAGRVPGRVSGPPAVAQDVLHMAQLAPARLPQGGPPGIPAALRDATSRAVAWLHTQQGADGGFSGAPGSPSSAAATSDVVYVLARLGQDPAGGDWTVNGHSATAALAALTPEYVGTDAGQAGKVARAVAAATARNTTAGVNPRSFAGLDPLSVIEADYDPASGRYSQDLLYRHTLAIEGLARSGVAVPPAAFDALLAARRPDGSWFWSFDASASDVDTTGRVVQMLAAYGGLRCAPVLGPSLDFLLRRHTGVGWAAGSAPGPANANSTALAVTGLLAAGIDPSAMHGPGAQVSALDSLLAYQEASGAFVYTHDPAHAESRLVATVDALDALAEFGDTAPACAPRYLPIYLAGLPD